MDLAFINRIVQQFYIYIEGCFLKQASRGPLHKAAISGQYETVKMLLEGGEDVDRRDQVLVLSSLCKLNVQQDLLPSLRSWILEFLSCPGCDRLTFSEGFRAIRFQPMKRGTTRACTNAFEYYMPCVCKQHFDRSVMTGSIIVTDIRRGLSQNILFWFTS